MMLCQNYIPVNEEVCIVCCIVCIVHGLENELEIK